VIVGLPAWFVALLLALVAVFTCALLAVAAAALDDRRRRSRRRRRRGFVGGASFATCYHPPARLRTARGRQWCTVCGAVGPAGGQMRPASYRGAAGGS
jgi:hypothetical protein